ncbi:MULTISPECIES: MotE family protein [unclassified Bacillus (in: firmicutes)]|uniref:MotE family protein n=1 Tax=unclassified Bacillus (in: firmicutes) TaxID=185979 RepID=UPI002280E509|nr:MotE family protein [Bacillus sp. S20C3]MCY8202915.1 MotE family protein [Bacillus sp. N12A5]MCY8287938.1 MotE family protein [Bacillus sp. N13C7]MCY8636728.1 MotE family protein [Bacillus sp. S17B2]MCY8718306.1 MotE family protein [Bacillus sp. S10C12M]MCY9143077.1 MotE family protein [Bacillus sp. T9C1]
MSGKKKESGKFRSVLLIVILPLMFLFIAGGIVLWAAGVNVLKPIQEAAAKTPVLKELVPEAENTKDTASSKDSSNTAALEKTIKNQKSEISILNKDLETSKSEIDRLNQKIRSLEKTAEDQKKSSENNNEGTSGSNSSSKDDKVISVYKSMDSGKAAKIITQLKEQEALKILNGLSKKQLADILAKMTPEQAATYTEKIAASQE